MALGFDTLKGLYSNGTLFFKVSIWGDLTNCKLNYFGEYISDYSASSSLVAR